MNSTFRLALAMPLLATAAWLSACAGDKTTQNVIGGFGVVQGSGGDLCTGLPRQSLFRDDGTAYHTPRRLTVIVAAPLQRVQDIVLGHDAGGDGGAGELGDDVLGRPYGER